MHLLFLEYASSFCWQALPKVSRSFALGIRLLPAGLKDAVMISYLLFRMSDTIEDSSYSHAQKRIFIRSFQTLLHSSSSNQRSIDTFVVSLGKHDFGPETFLFHHAADVFTVFFSLPQEARQYICSWLTEMNTHAWKYNTKKIHTFAEQNKYCYHVAGVVGHLLTDLFAYYEHYTSQKKHELHLLAADFGLALQKVNIIKDIYKDVAEKRYYWPLTLLQKHRLSYTTLFSPQRLPAALLVLQEMLADVIPYINKAAQYIFTLPKRSFRVRLFCGLSLFMAIASLRTYRQQASVLFMGAVVKMRRRQVYLLLASLSLLVWSRFLLLRFYTLYVKKLL